MFYNNTDYAYSVGRIRVLETNLLKNNDIERMIGAKNAEEALRVLNDLDYSNHVSDISDVKKFQVVLSAGLKEVKDLLDDITPYKEVMDILWFYYDIHNIKTLIRAKYDHHDENDLEENYFMRLGSYSHNLFEKYIFEGTYKDKIPQDILLIIDEAIKVYENNKDPFKLDLFLDKQYYRRSLSVSKKIKNLFIDEYLRISIDISNIKQFFISYILSKEKKEFSDTMLPGGYIKVGDYLKMGSIEDLLNYSKKTSYAETIKAGYESYSKDNSLLELEKLLDNLVIKHLEQSKIIPFGPEPLYAYFLAKRNNAQIIRSIMISKINNIDENSLRKTLRKLYI